MERAVVDLTRIQKLEAFIGMFCCGFVIFSIGQIFTYDNDCVARCLTKVKRLDCATGLMPLRAFFYPVGMSLTVTLPILSFFKVQVIEDAPPRSKLVQFICDYIRVFLIAAAIAMVAQLLYLNSLNERYIPDIFLFAGVTLAFAPVAPLLTLPITYWLQNNPIVKMLYQPASQAVTTERSESVQA